jgi:hypothetical protein
VLCFCAIQEIFITFVLISEAVSSVTWAASLQPIQLENGSKQFLSDFYWMKTDAKLQSDACSQLFPLCAQCVNSLDQPEHCCHPSLCGPAAWAPLSQQPWPPSLMIQYQQHRYLAEIPSLHDAAQTAHSDRNVLPIGECITPQLVSMIGANMNSEGLFNE